MTTPNNGNTPGDNSPSGDSPYGYEPYPDNPAGSHPENTGSSAWNPDSAGSAGTTGSGQSDFGQNSYGAYGANGYGSSEYGSNSYGASGSNTYGQGGFGPNGYEQFDVNAAAGAAGATALRYHGQELTDGTYGDGATPHPINDPANNGWTHTKGNGKLNITDAFSWAFKTTFSNWKVWIVLGLIACAWQWLTMIVPTGVLGIVPLFVYPVFFSAALQQTLARSFGWGDIKTPAYGKTLGVLAVFFAVVTVGMFVFLTIGMVAGFSSVDLNALPENPTSPEDFEALLPLLGPLLGSMGLLMLIAWFVSPFLMMTVWYASENNGSFGQAFSKGFADGKRNYLPLLGLAVLAGLLSFVGYVLAFLGMIIATPVVLLAQAHAYRQISGGPVPVEDEFPAQL